MWTTYGECFIRSLSGLHSCLSLPSRSSVHLGLSHLSIGGLWGIHWMSHPHWPGLSNCPVQSVHNLLHLLSEYDLLNHLLCIDFFRFILDRHGAKGSMCLHKEWASTPTPFAFQTTVADIATYAPEYREKTMTLSEFFPAKSQCFVMSPPHYGSLAEVAICLSLSLC